MKPSLPIIDIAALATADSSALERVANDIAQACKTSGFFYVSGHGIADSNVCSIRNTGRQFFALPESIKSQYSINQQNRGYLGFGHSRMHGAKQVDLKEVFFWGPDLPENDPDLLAGIPLCGPNRWPDASVWFRETVQVYSRLVQTAGDRLLAAIAVSLGCAPDFFQPFYRSPMLRGQLIHYPPPHHNNEEQFGVAPHTDFGCITLLLQETPGLEVLSRSGEWIAASPIPGTLVVNIGDLLERWSNRRLPSTRHRVRNTSEDDRYSIAMFYDPSPRAVVNPRDMAETEKAQFDPIGAADYILGRNKGAFSHYEETPDNA